MEQINAESGKVGPSGRVMSLGLHCGKSTLTPESELMYRASAATSAPRRVVGVTFGSYGRYCTCDTVRYGMRCYALYATETRSRCGHASRYLKLCRGREQPVDRGCWLLTPTILDHGPGGRVVA